ncbi:MAG: ester cyclase [Novosphingobium sp.]
MSGWDDLPEVRSPAGRPIAELLEEGPRRQDLPGYEPIYRDFVDYIIRCTHRIWEEKNVGLCRTHYGADCQVHTLSGPTVGAEAVVQNTINALAACPDRRVIGEDVIWSADEDARLYSSHRIMSRATHAGDDALLGAASMRSSGVMTIADCACVENRIVEEWLVRDNLRAVWQVGGDPLAVAAAQAEADRTGDQSRHGWRTAAIARTRGEPDVAIPPDHPSVGPAAMLALAFREDNFGAAAEALSSCVELRWPSNRHGYGRGYWIGCLTQLRGSLHDIAWRLDHVAARPLPDNDVAVALRWSLAGHHSGGGAWGQASGRELYILACSHYRVRAGSIVEDATVFDELAILRQIAGGLGA